MPIVNGKFKVENLVTNFEKKYLQRYRKAIAKFKEVNPNIDLYLEEKAWSQGMRELETHHALHCKPFRDKDGLKKFWDIYDELFTTGEN